MTAAHNEQVCYETGEKGDAHMHLPGQRNSIRQPQRRQHLRKSPRQSGGCKPSTKHPRKSTSIQKSSCQRHSAMAHRRAASCARTFKALLQNITLMPRACRQRPSSSPNVKMRTAPSSAAASWLRAPAGLPGSDSPSAAPSRPGLQPESCHAGSCQAGSCALRQGLGARHSTVSRPCYLSPN